MAVQYMTVVSSNPDSMTAFRDRLCGLCEDFERLHAQGIHLKAQEQYERLTGEITPTQKSGPKHQMIKKHCFSICILLIMFVFDLRSCCSCVMWVEARG